MSSDEAAFQDSLAKELKNYGWYVKKEVVDNTREHRLDLLAYHSLIDCWIGFELKTPKENSDYTKCLTQLIEYRKSQFLPSLHLLCLFSNENVDWYHYRYFWRFGFGVGERSHLGSRYVRFPPNGDQKTTLRLQDLAWKTYSLYHEGFDPKKQVEEIFSVCIPRWKIFGYEYKR